MPSSSLFLRSSTTLVSILSFISTAAAAPRNLARQATTPNYSYTLAKEYSGSTFFDDSNFDYFTASDPTHGFVTYGDHNYASSNNLIGFEGDYAVMKVDSTTNLGRNNDPKYWEKNKSSYYNVNGLGRKSVRIEGKYEFTHGLIITDVKQMPSGICGTWPAFWTLGKRTWPQDGEIDIIEGANLQGGNWMSLHTGSDSSISGNTDSFSAQIQATDCNVHVGATDPNYTGCKFVDGDAKTYDNYQTNGGVGGVWATQWTSDRIKIWFWPYSSVPADVTNGSPKPGTAAWGKPRSSFAPPENLKVDQNFANHHIVFDTTFCGDLGDATWSTSGCAGSTGHSSCADYVANTPNAFANAAWKVKYVKIFSEGPIASTTTSSSTTKSTTSSKSTTTSAVTTTSSSSSLSTTTSKVSTSSSSSSVVSMTTSKASTTSSSSSVAPTTSSISSSSSSSVTTSASTSKSSSSVQTTTSSGVPTTSSSSSKLTTSSSSVTTSASTSQSTTTSSDRGISTTPSAPYTTPVAPSTTSSSSVVPSSTTSTTIKVSTTPSTTSSSSVSKTPTTSSSSVPTTTTSESTTSTYSKSDTTSTSSSYSNEWEAWSTASSTTSSGSSWDSWTATTTNKPVTTWTNDSDRHQTTTYTSKKGGAFYGNDGDDQDKSVTKTVTEVVTEPCTTAPGYETKTYTYTTIIPYNSETSSAWGTWDPIKSTTATTPSAESTWATWDTSQPSTTSTSVNNNGDIWNTWDPSKSSTSSSASAQTWGSWDPSKPSSKPSSDSTTWSAWSGSSVSASSKPSSIDPSRSSWTGAVVTQTVKPLPESTSSWATWSSVSTAKVPDASSTASSAWNTWSSNTPASATQTGNIAVYKGAAASVRTQIMAVVALAVFGGMMML